ncbi:MAG: MotA/TolQ/ExbB proton channel family protein [Pirellulaceae bacterium]
MRFGNLAADRPHFRWARWATYGLLLLLWLGWQQAGLPRPAAWAQEDKLEDVTETPPPTAPAAPAPSGARAAEDAEVPSSLLDMFIDSGIIGYIITLLSVVAVGFMVEHAMTIRKNVLMPEQVVADVDNLIRQGQIDEALQYCQQPENQSLFANVVLAGLERYRSSEFGFAEYKAAVEEEGEEQTSGLYRKTEVLGVIGAIAPMLGLLGTVQGMIMGFNKIASSGGSARPDELASSISLALVTTFEGLVVAIPTMVAFSFFRNRIDTLVAEAGKRVEQVLGPLGRRRT